MFPWACSGYGFWWIFPVIMIALMVLCFFMMRGWMDSMMCGSGPRDTREEEAKKGMGRRD